MKYKAFIFDLNGTIIDDMKYHSEAWFQILNNLGANLTREEVDKEMYGKNVELLLRVFGKNKFTDEEMHALSVNKEKAYQETYRPHLKLIDGLGQFLNLARKHHIKMAIGSAAIMFNIDYILDGLSIREYFDAVISADHVTASKPHPETFLKCAEALFVHPQDCLVFEDVPKGVEAAENAGMQCVVITTGHQPHQFNCYNNITLFVDNYNHEKLLQLFS